MIEEDDFIVQTKFDCLTFGDFSVMYRALVSNITEKFTQKDIEKFLENRATIDDYIHCFFFENREYFTTKDFLDVTQNEKNLLSELVGDKFIHYFKVNFESDIYNILFERIPFPHRSFDDMKNHIEERRI